MFARLGPRAEALKPGLSTTIAADLDDLARAAGRGGLPTGVIHADFFPDNVFFTAGKFAGGDRLLFRLRRRLAYDLAVALNAWCFEPDGIFNITGRAGAAGRLRGAPAAERRGAGGAADPGPRRGHAVLPDPAERLGRDPGRRPGAAARTRWNTSASWRCTAPSPDLVLFGAHA